MTDDMSGRPVPAELDKALRRTFATLGEIMEDGRSFLIERLFDQIKDFRCEIFPNESQHRGRPHCKMTADEKSAVFDIRTGEKLVGDLGRWERTASKAVQLHSAALLDFWIDLRPDDQKL